MADINNRETLKRIEEDASLHPALEPTPKQLSNTVIPVLVANPNWYSNICKTAQANNGTVTIYTTPSDADFYLTYAAGWTYSATADQLIIIATIEGVATRIVGHYDSDASSIAFFPFPIKIDRGTAITVGNSAAVVCQGTIAGFIKYVD